MSSAMYRLRPAELPADLPAMAHLLSLTEPEPLSVERVREQRQSLAGLVRLTLMALDDGGEVTGMVDAGPTPWTRPGLFRATLIVDPAWRNRGIGSRLLEEALRFSQVEGAGWLEAPVRDDAPEALEFAERRGFHVGRHTHQSTLDLEAFDEGPFVGALERALANGYRFFSLADLGPVTDDARHRLYDLNREAGVDNPSSGGFFAPFDEFRKAILDASWFRADGQILAADGDLWVGLAAVALFAGAGYAYNGFTGVRRAYRGQGLAQALKLLAIRWAREQGVRVLRTDNDSRNAPMLAINRKFGYQPEPGVYHVVRGLDSSG